MNKPSKSEPVRIFTGDLLPLLRLEFFYKGQKVGYTASLDLFHEDPRLAAGYTELVNDLLKKKVGLDVPFNGTIRAYIGTQKNQEDEVTLADGTVVKRTEPRPRTTNFRKAR